MIYSVISQDIIFADSERDRNIQFEEIYYKGNLLQVYYNENKNYIIERILSTNPYDYLNDELQPGNTIKISY